MKRKLICLLMLLALALVAIAGCQPTEKTPEPDNGPFDASKVAVSGAAETLTAELGSRYEIPVPSVKYAGWEKEVTFDVVDSADNEVEIISRGTRIFVEDVNGYTVRYYIEHLEESHRVASSKIDVSDTVGPEIALPASAYSMVVYIDSVVEIPVPAITDKSGVVESSAVKVMFGDQTVDYTPGENGAIGSFVADRYGKYTIEYSAKDGSGNETVVPVTVDCARMATLCDFKNDRNVWVSGMKFTTEHSYSGNAITVTTYGNAHYEMLAVYPSYYNLSGFDRLAINIWVSRDLTSGNEGFYLLNQVFRLQEGDNVLVIDRETLNSQYPGGIVPSSLPQYNAMNYLYFQLCGDNVTWYIDNLVGVFDDFETDTAAPTIDFGRDRASGIFNVDEGSAVVVPEVFCYDNTLEEVTVDYAVKKADGTDITSQVRAGTYRAELGEVYTVTYTAKDVNNLTSTRDLTINVRAEEIMEIAPGDDLPAGREYDMLQDFETGLDSSVAVSPANMVPDAEKALTETYARAGKAMMIGPNAKSFGALKIRLLKDGKRLTESDFAAYEYLQISIVCTVEGTQFWFYNQQYILKKGLNVVKIPKAVFTAQLNDVSYDANGWLWCQTSPVSASLEFKLYLDQFIGVYPEGYDPETPVGPETPKGYDVLQDFETGAESSVSFEGAVEVVSEHAVEGNAVKVTTSKDWQGFFISVKKGGKVLTREEIAAYDYFEITIYADKAGATLYFYNMSLTPLAVGENTVRITSEEFLAQMDLENSTAYRPDGWSFWQIGNGAGAYTLWLDQLVGVYPEEDDPEAPKGCDELQTFETGAESSVSFEGTVEVVSEHAVKGNAVKVTTSKDWQALMISIKKDGKVLTREEIAAYDYFEITIYADKAGATLYFLNQSLAELKEGENVIRISSEDFLAQMDASAAAYRADGWSFWQIGNGSAGFTLWLDHLVGVYPAAE